MAINWRQEADNIVDTDDIFENNEDVLDTDSDPNMDMEDSDISNPITCKTEEFERNYGKFIVNQEPYIQPEERVGAGPTTTNIGCIIEIDFEPNRKRVNASEIAFVQIIQWLDKANGNKTIDGMSNPKVNPYNVRRTNGWWLDRGFAINYLPRMYKFAWYGYPNTIDGNPNSVDTTDESPLPLPNSDPFTRTDLPVRRGICTSSDYKIAYFCDWPSGSRTDNNNNIIRKESARFEVYAIAKEGKQKNQIYGGISWGFDYNHLPLPDQKNKFEHKIVLSEIKFLEKPSSNFKKCVNLWNKQTTLPLDNPSATAPTKNHPDQQPLKIFK